MTDPYVCHFCGNIYHQQKPQMLEYIPYMDPMGDRSWCRNSRIDSDVLSDSQRRNIASNKPIAR